MTSHEVKCLICGEVCQGRLIYHLKKVHNLTTKDYRKEFPGASVLCKDEEDLIKKRLIERNKSEKQRAIISQRNHDPEFQRKCQEGCTVETRRAQAENMRKVSKKCWEDSEYRENHRMIARETQLRENQKPEVIKRKSDLSKQLWMNPEYAAKSLAAPKRHPYGRQCTYHSNRFDRDFWCRSQGEYEFLVLCDSLSQVINVLSGEKMPIKYNDADRATHVYLPDFIVTTDEQTYIVEIKYEDDSILNYRDKVNAAVEFCKSQGLVYCYINRFSGISKVRNLGFNSVAVLERI